MYIGTFAALLYLTSRSLDEAIFYKQLLDDYRWILRVNSRSVSFIDLAVQRLDVSLSHLDQISPQDIVGETPTGLSTISLSAHEHEQEDQPEQYTNSPQSGTIETQGFTSMMGTAPSSISPNTIPADLFEGLDFFGQDWNG